MDMVLVTFVVTKPCQPLWAGDLSRQGQISKGNLSHSDAAKLRP
jgi:hypothetical protein